jgi:UDP-glucose 4-epimerase
LGLAYLEQGRPSEVFNLGNGSGFSVKQVIDCAKQVTGRSFPVVYGDRRPGDPSILVGSSSKAREILGWQAQYADLGVIIEHAWRWHQVRHS